MKLAKVFALTLLLSTGMTQCDYNWQRGLTDVAVGLGAGVVSARWVPNGYASIAVDALGQSAIADAGLDAIAGSAGKPEAFDAQAYALMRIRHAAAMFGSALFVKSLAIGKGGVLDQLPLVGEAISHSLGEFPLACFSYLGLSNLIDGFTGN